MALKQMERAGVWRPGDGGLIKKRKIGNKRELESMSRPHQEGAPYGTGRGGKVVNHSSNGGGLFDGGAGRVKGEQRGKKGGHGGNSCGNARYKLLTEG